MCYRLVTAASLKLKYMTKLLTVSLHKQREIQLINVLGDKKEEKI